MAGLTRYELQALAPDGRKFLAGYVRIPSRASAVKMLRQNGEAWAKVAGATQFRIEGQGRMGWKLLLGGWAITYSGRTKLEAERSPLPFFKQAEGGASC